MVDASVKTIEQNDLNPQTVAKEVLALLVAALLATNERHADMIQAEWRMSLAAERYLCTTLLFEREDIKPAGSSWRYARPFDDVTI